MAIGQASHAWLSGQIARAWGNSRFGPVTPREEVCLGAEQHDVGMALWDTEPELNPATGRPRSFMEMPLATHIELWSQAAPRMVSQSRYAAMLVSMHGTTLYGRRDLRSMPDEDARAVRSFLEGQREFQSDLLGALRADPVTAPFAAPDLVERNRLLIRTWDTLSLALCLDWDPFEIEAVPTAGEPVTLRLRAAGEAVELEPWPFSGGSVEVHCEGRLLEARCDSQGALERALRGAPWTSVEFTLAPRRGDGPGA